MKIVICPKCKKKIHKANKCLYCGNTDGFEVIENISDVHENVETEFEKLQDLLDKGSFDETVKVASKVLKWMPTCSQVFWINLLAKNKCRTDAELVQKGISCADNPEFFNAVRFGSDNEKAVYEEVKRLIAAVQISLEKYITEHEREAKQATSILQYQSDFTEFIAEKRKKLYGFWSEIQQIEHEMYAIEKECKLFIYEEENSLKKIKEATYDYKNKIYRLEKCSAEDFYKYQIELEALSHQIVKTQNAMYVKRMENSHVSYFYNLVKKRDAIVKEINLEFSKLEAYREKIEAVVSNVHEIEIKHQEEMYFVQNYDFRNSCSLLGAEKYEEALTSAGLASVSGTIDLSSQLIQLLR